jgi:hypothetical protein
MDTANDIMTRLKYLREQHKKIHDIVESLEAEKAPEKTILRQKKAKLSVKDEIAVLETELKLKGVKYVD